MPGVSAALIGANGSGPWACDGTSGRASTIRSDDASGLDTLDGVTRRRQLILAGVVLVGLGLLFLARSRISATLTLLEAVNAPVPRLLAPDVAGEPTRVGGVEGLLFDGAGPGILIVPGATPAGLDDTRVDVVARSLARAGRTVFVPELDLYDEQFTPADLDRIVEGTLGLAESTGDRVTVAGFSYGGSFALVAAADPRMDGHVSRVATLGAYYDLVGVIQAITSGGSLVGDRFIPWDGHPRAKQILTDRTVELLPPEAQQAVRAALAGQVDPGAMSPEARSLYEILSNDDPALTGELAMRLPAELRSLIENFSPSRFAHRIDVPVLAMHSIDDPVVPYGEVVRLGEAMPGADTLTVEVFQHVDFEPTKLSNWWSLAPDLWKIWGFTTWILDD